MDTVDSVGAYWSFYSIWNCLNVLPMTQSDAPNEASQWGECYDEAVKILSDGDENYKLRRIADLLLANKKMHVAPNEGREEKITPSPWKVKTAKELLRPTTYEIRNFDNLLIATVNIGMSDVEENAKLIASAPTLRDQLSKEREMRKEELIMFKRWYDKLSPSDKCTVWPAAGSGGGTGLYNMPDEDLIDKFLRHQAKASELDKNN